jgi:hypothetical protein
MNRVQVFKDSRVQVVQVEKNNLVESLTPLKTIYRKEHDRNKS